MGMNERVPVVVRAGRQVSTAQPAGLLWRLSAPVLAASLLVVSVNPKAASVETVATNTLAPASSIEPATDFALANPEADPETSNDSRLAVGDRLKIMFFERIRAATGPEASFSQSFIERTELTGEYVIQSDGNASIGLLGETKLEGEIAAAAQKKLELAYKAAFGKEARAVMSIVEREPVYILGPVAKPGTYEYSPGMTVLHALARAGGPTTAAPGSVDYFESVREAERYEQSIQKQRKLLASIAVLEAERDRALPSAPHQLILLAGAARADSLIAEADSIRKLNREIRKSRLDALDATIAAASRELKSQNSRMSHIKSNLESKSARLQSMKELAERQAANRFNYLQAASEVSDMQERLDEALGQASQIEDRGSQAELEKSRLVIDARLELERDIATGQDQLVLEQRSAATSEKVLRASANLRPPGETEASRFEVTILRRQSDGSREIAATGSSRLQPGDLVRVKSPSADSQTGLAPADAQSEFLRAHPVPGHAKNSAPVIQ